MKLLSFLAASLASQTVLSWTPATASSSRRHQHSSRMVVGLSSSSAPNPSENDVATTSSGTATPPVVPSAEIVGGGRIGSLLAEAGHCVVLGRKDTIDPTAEGCPIFIATRNDALDSIIDHCPPNRRADLVFLQNGYLTEYLRHKGLDPDITQALLYVSVTAKGVPAIDGVTTCNPEGLTAATGRHAQALADRLAALNLKCNVLDPVDFQPAMFEKLMYVAF